MQIEKAHPLEAYKPADWLVGGFVRKCAFKNTTIAVAQITESYLLGEIQPFSRGGSLCGVS
jgi:hypothetical protein